MDREEPGGRRLVHDQEVPEVGAGPAGAHGAPAVGVQRGVGVGVLRPLQVVPALGRQDRAVAAEPGGEHAVEQVDAEGDGLHHPHGVAHAHEVAGPVVGQQGQRGREGGEHLGPLLAHRQAADGVAVEADGDRALGALRPQGQVGAPLHDAELRQLGPVLVEEGGPGPGGPVGRAVHGQAEHCRRRRERGAHVEHHLEVGAEGGLDLHRGAGVRRWVVPS